MRGVLQGLTVEGLRVLLAGHQPVPEEAQVVGAVVQVVGHGPVHSQRGTPQEGRLRGQPPQQLGYVVLLYGL